MFTLESLWHSLQIYILCMRVRGDYAEQMSVYHRADAIACVLVIDMCFNGR